MKEAESAIIINKTYKNKTNPPQMESLKQIEDNLVIYFYNIYILFYTLNSYNNKR